MLPSIQEANTSKSKTSALSGFMSVKSAPLRPASSNSLSNTDRKQKNASSEFSPEKKIQTAINNIQEAFIDKVTGLEETIEQWMKKCSLLENKVEELETFSTELQAKLATSEKNHHELSTKHDTLLNSRNELVKNYNQLRRYALELDNFKKNIINLSGPNSVTIDANMMDQSIAIEGEKLVPKVNGTSGGFKHGLGDFKGSSPFNDNRESVSKASSHRFSEFDRRSHGSNGKPGNEFCYPSRKQHNGHMTTNGLQVLDDHQSRDPQKSKAIEVYDRILADIEPEDYERFSNAIEDYNNNVISHQTALKVFREVIQNDRDFEEMKGILLDTRVSDE